MNTLRLPQGLRPILDARLAGKRPAELIHVTDWPDLSNFLKHNGLPAVFAKPLDDSWDWRALHGLDVVVVGVDGVPPMDALKDCRPTFLRILGAYGWQHVTGNWLCE